MKIDEKTFKTMPAELQALFSKCPNPGSDEVVGLFPVTKSGVGGQPQTAARTGNSGVTGLASNGVKIGHGDSGSAARFFYCAKASKKDRDEGCEGLEYVLDEACPEEAKREIEALLTSMR